MYGPKVSVPKAGKGYDGSARVNSVSSPSAVSTGSHAVRAGVDHTKGLKRALLPGDQSGSVGKMIADSSGGGPNPPNNNT
jgi:hypothetical protein